MLSLMFWYSFSRSFSLSFSLCFSDSFSSSDEEEEEGCRGSLLNKSDDVDVDVDANDVGDDKGNEGITIDIIWFVIFVVGVVIWFVICLT